MNNTPPNDPNQKKGLSGLAMAGIGCGGLLLIAMLGVGLLVMRGCQKAKEIAGDFQKNPAKTAAMFALKANPDLEVVGSDDAKGEITVKDKKSGEVTTLSFNDISQGKFTMKNGKGEEMSIDASGAKEGKVVMKGPDGQTVIGDSAATPAPSWVPAYPGLQSQPGGMRIEKGGELKGLAVAQTTDAVAKVKEFYDVQLKGAGFQTEVNTTSIGGTETATVNAKKDDGKQTVNIVISVEGGKTNVMVSYEGPKQ